MKILITGTDGYIGCLLAQLLAKDGHEIIGLDTGYYRDGWLYHGAPEHARLPQTVNCDIRHIRPEQLSGLDAVVHLAELSNDPLGENKPEITQQINHEGSVRLAGMAKDEGVPRFVYTSSCSVYGVGDGSGFLDETSPTNPQTSYAKCKVSVEQDVGKLAAAGFAPVFLRNATAYGPSPRMRFDIVLNNLSALAWVYRKIAMTSDGTPWRPLVHVLDICEAIRCALTAPSETVSGQIYNVGQDSENYQVREIAEIVADVFPGCELTIGEQGGDNRSYRVSFDKIHRELPGFACHWDARKGALQLRRIFEQIRMSESDFEFRAFTRLKQLKYLIETSQIDDDFFWSVE